MRKTTVMIGALLVLLVSVQITAPVNKTKAVDLSSMDSDYDGCSDSEEIARGLDPNSFFDFPDFDSDRQINALDTQSVSFRWGAAFGSPLYNVKFDRQGGVGGGPDGDIDISDLQLVYGRFGLRCQGVPAPTVAQVCAELQGEAQTAGFTNPSEFTCSGDPLPQSVGLAGDQMKKRQIQVTIDVDKSAIVKGIDLEMLANGMSSGAAGITQPDPIPTAPPAGHASGTVTGPLVCLIEVCHVTLTNRAEIRHLRGHGPNCAWMSYKQEYDEYYPWHVITNVRQPVVESGASAPCSEEDRTTGVDRANLPFFAESWAQIKWVLGIPTPWGPIGLRTFHPEIRAWFDGWYDVDWS